MWSSCPTLGVNVGKARGREGKMEVKGGIVKISQDPPRVGGGITQDGLSFVALTQRRQSASPASVSHRPF